MLKYHYYIQCMIWKNIYDDENIWSLLLYSGYITASKQIDRKTYLVRLVNFEIADTIEETFLKSAYSILAHMNYLKCLSYF